MSVEASDIPHHRSHPPAELPQKKKKKAKKSGTDGRDKESSRKHSKEKKRKRDEHHDERANPSKKVRSDPTTSQPTTEDAPQPPLDSPFHTRTSSLYLPLSPISQSHPLEGLCAEHLSPLILTYYPPFHAVVLSYSNVRLSESPTVNARDHETRVLARSVDEYAVSYAWVTADFLLFSPRKSERIEGWINLQNSGHLGLVCWNLFNASIERSRLPKDWTWIEAGGSLRGRSEASGGVGSQKDGFNREERGEGHYEDATGRKIEGMVSFRVRDLETSFDRDRGFLSIEGTMLEEKEENLLNKRNGARGRSRPARGEEIMVNGGPDPAASSSRTEKNSRGGEGRSKHRIAY